MSRLIAIVAFAALTFVSNACEKVPLLAPTDSTLTLSLGGETRMALNATRQVTAIVLESSGTAPQNGTVVTFVTDLGRFEPIEARTTNGLATSTFHSGDRSGTATIRAFSGGASTGEGEASTTILVGGAGADLVSLRVESTSADGTVYNIVAVVVDADGNRVSGAPVTFTATAGAVITPSSTNADANGEARATVAINAATSVTADSGAGTGSLELAAPGSLAIVQTTPAPGTAAEVDSPVTFTITPTGGFFTNVTVDFGDSGPQNIGTVSAARTITHTYTQGGNYSVTVRGTSSTGALSQSQTSVVVGDPQAVTVTLTTSTPVVSLGIQQGLVSFTVAPAFPAGTALSRVDWNFGDGASDRNTATQNSHRYTAPGTYIASVVVTGTGGRQGTGSVTVRVTP